MSTINNKRIAKNTLMLYFRQILIMLVSLYTVRVVLNTLGVEDYGIYNVVAGVVTMFGFISGAMATASQRYFSFEMGRVDVSDEEKSAGLKKVFGVTLTIYVLLAFIIVLLAETVGFWFVCNKLVIPAERMVAAKWIYQFAILSFIVTILTTPYMSLLIAHENMNVYAWASIVEVVLKLGSVFLLTALPYDKLSVYGFLLFVVTFINTILYRVYCRIKYTECRFQFVWDKKLCREISSFIGWNFFGSFAWILKTQGISILLNIHFGPIINTARGIANQVRSTTLVFSQNFSLAIRPQLIKTYAVKNYDEMFVLLFRSCKMTFFLMLIVILPLVNNLNYILSLWLGSVPPYVVVFTKLLLMESLAESISLPMMSVNQATGKIKAYQMTIGFISFCNLPCAFILLKFGFTPESVFVVGIALEILISFIRMFFLNNIKKGVAFECMKKVILPCAFSIFIAWIICLLLPLHANTFLSLLFIVFLQLFIILFVITFVGINYSERKFIYSMIRKKVKNILSWFRIL